MGINKLDPLSALTVKMGGKRRGGWGRREGWHQLGTDRKDYSVEPEKTNKALLKVSSTTERVIAGTGVAGRSYVCNESNGNVYSTSRLQPKVDVDGCGQALVSAAATAPW